MKGFLSYWMVNSKDQNHSKASDQLVLFERQITKLRIDRQFAACVYQKAYIEFKNCNYFWTLGNLVL